MKTILSALLLTAGCLSASTWASNSAFGAHTSDLSSNVSNIVLQDVARAGARLVAVGERGVVLLSDDEGLHWRQAVTPVTSTLSGVQFVNEKSGWAIGHAGTVLHTENGGQSWTLQLNGLQAAKLEAEVAARSSDTRRISAAQRLVDDGADKPFLALHFTDERHGLVVGAYGLAFATSDGGETWRSMMGDVPNPQGLHIYAIAVQGETIVLAGEQGLLLRSDNSGALFRPISAPYDGSFFAAEFLRNGRLIVAGLRGNAFASDDNGHSFRAIQNTIPASVNAIRSIADDYVMVNQAGMLLRGRSDSLNVMPAPVSEGIPLTAVAVTSDGSLITTGMAGVRRLVTLISGEE